MNLGQNMPFGAEKDGFMPWILCFFENIVVFKYLTISIM